MREEGFGSDAGRPSLTEVGAGGAYASFAACRLCGIACAPGTTFCPNCGAIQRPGGVAIAPRASVVEPLSPPPHPKATPATTGPRVSPSPIASAPSGAARPEPSYATAPAATRGERLVAWSALGVLVVAAVFVAHRLDDLSTAPASAPVAVAVREPVPARRPAPDRPAAYPRIVASDGVPSLAPARDAIAAARHATKPAPKPRTYASRKPAPRAMPATDVAAAMPDAAPPEPVLIATAQAIADPRTHWDEMRDAIAACSTGDFLEGVICQQRVRIRYCVGWWGQSVDCPSRRDEYGN